MWHCCSLSSQQFVSVSLFILSFVWLALSGVKHRQARWSNHISHFTYTSKCDQTTILDSRIFQLQLAATRFHCQNTAITGQTQVFYPVSLITCKSCCDQKLHNKKNAIYKLSLSQGHFNISTYARRSTWKPIWKIALPTDLLTFIDEV